MQQTSQAMEVSRGTTSLKQGLRLERVQFRVVLALLPWAAVCGCEIPGCETPGVILGSSSHEFATTVLGRAYVKSSQEIRSALTNILRVANCFGTTDWHDRLVDTAVMVLAVATIACTRKKPFKLSTRF